jgi:2-polyprenyl-3-methyl-5-hydroxy-6-metoxy-1,4-benzoquinol methylase
VVGSKSYNDKPDRRKLYAYAIGVDLFEGKGVDIVHDMERPLSAGTFDHVDCVSVLEHVRRPWLMAANIEAAMEPHATILVSVPFVWRIHGYPGDLWRMTAEALEVLFPSIHWMDTKFLVEGNAKKMVPSLTARETRWLARSELIAAGFKCA